MKYEAIRACSREFSVVKMCKALGLRASNYYRWKKNQEKKEEKEREDRELAAKVREVFIRNKRLYGYRKMQRALEKEGIVLSEYKVRQIMRRTGLYPVSMRRYRPGRYRSVGEQYAENELQQDFHAEEPGKVLTGDITYIRTNLGWAYLAAVMDLYNREIVGYAVSMNIDTELVKRALGNAIARCGGLKGAIFHSDRGSQYISEGYKRMLEENGIRQSMSRGGNPYDNACTESFFATAKKECIYLKKYATIEEVKRDVYEYVELFYNRKRMHSALGYMSPVEYRLTHCA